MATYKPIPSLTLQQIEAFWSRVRVDMYDSDACWLWTGCLNPGGYGRVRVGSGLYGAHRVAFSIVRGPIPDGLTLDHLCRKPACCNPAHLEPVTAVENTMRGDALPAKNARKTHCDKGHPLVDRAGSRNQRICKICQRERDTLRPNEPNKHNNLRAKGRCVRCGAKSEAYRCDRCRRIHNEQSHRKRQDPTALTRTGDPHAAERTE